MKADGLLLLEGDSRIRWEEKADTSVTWEEKASKKASWIGGLGLLTLPSGDIVMFVGGES